MKHDFRSHGSLPTYLSVYDTEVLQFQEHARRLGRGYHYQ